MPLPRIKTTEARVTLLFQSGQEQAKQDFLSYITDNICTMFRIPEWQNVSAIFSKCVSYIVLALKLATSNVSLRYISLRVNRWWFIPLNDHIKSLITILTYYPESRWWEKRNSSTGWYCPDILQHSQNFHQKECVLAQGENLRLSYLVRQSWSPGCLTQYQSNYNKFERN